MDSWEKFDKTTLPPKKDFYSELNLEDITDKDYSHAQKVFEEFCTDIDEYHDLYVQSDTLLLADVLENFRNMCLEIYDVDPIYFVSSPGLAWQVCLKKTEVKLELIQIMTWYDWLKRELGAEFSKHHLGMIKQIISIWKIMIKTINHHI